MNINGLITGCVDFSFIGGFTEGFLNECMSKGVDIRHIVKTDDGLLALCDVKTYRQLHHIAFNHGGVVRVIARHGLPFITYALKGRWGFYSGIVAFVLIVSLLSGFVWDVQWVGFDKVDVAPVEECLKQNGLKQGAMWSSINKDSLAMGVMAQFDDVSWVHINKVGTTAVVEINETTHPPVEKTEKEKGQLPVYRRKIVLTVSRTAVNSIKTGEKSYYSLYFYGAKIPLYFSRKRGVTSEHSKTLDIKGKALPIGITEYKESYYVKEEYQLSDSALTALAKSQLQQATKSKFTKDEQIVNENISTKINKENCVITGAYVIRSKK